MRAEKKTLVKEDGRYLVFYHFEGTADNDQTEAFQCLNEQAVQIGSETTGGGAAPAAVRAARGGSANV